MFVISSIVCPWDDSCHTHLVALTTLNEYERHITLKGDGCNRVTLLFCYIAVTLHTHRLTVTSQSTDSLLHHITDAHTHTHTHTHTRTHTHTHTHTFLHVQTAPILVRSQPMNTPPWLKHTLLQKMYILSFHGQHSHPHSVEDEGNASQMGSSLQ